MNTRAIWLAMGMIISQGFSGTAQQQTSCSAAEYRQFDFWIGDWDVIDAPTQRRVGRNTVQNLLNGCMIQENWIDNVDAPGGRAISQNYYDPKDKKWVQVYITNAGDGALLLTGTFKNNAMILETDRFASGSVVAPLQRITWNVVDNNPDRVRQLGEISNDAGQTWKISFDALYERRK
jgi:hypothetical protein